MAYHKPHTFDFSGTRFRRRVLHGYRAGQGWCTELCLWGDETVFSQWCLCIKDVDQSRFACLARNMSEEYEIIWTCASFHPNLHSSPHVHILSHHISITLQPSPTISNRSPRTFLDVWKVIKLANGGQWIAQGIHVRSRVHGRLGTLKTRRVCVTGYTRTIQPSRTDFCQVVIHLYPIFVGSPMVSLGKTKPIQRVGVRLPQCPASRYPGVWCLLSMVAAMAWAMEFDTTSTAAKKSPSEIL